MNVKINDTQKTEATPSQMRNFFPERRPTFDENKLLTKCLMVAFDEIFRWQKISCYAVLQLCKLMRETHCAEWPQGVWWISVDDMFSDRCGVSPWPLSWYALPKTSFSFRCCLISVNLINVPRASSLFSNLWHFPLQQTQEIVVLFDRRRACLPENVISKNNNIVILLHLKCWKRGRELAVHCFVHSNSTRCLSTSREPSSGKQFWTPSYKQNTKNKLCWNLQHYRDLVNCEGILLLRNRTPGA